MTVPNPIVTITNQSGVDVEIFDVYNSNPGGTKGLYTYTALGKIASGANASITTRHFASQLLAIHTGPVAAINNNYYEQFPVAVMAVSILDDTSLQQTITADDKAGMEQAFLFARYASANADSKLTKQFVAALNTTDQSTAVDTFFAGTANFSKVTMAAWSAVTTWQSQFLSAWQGPCYLYQNDTAAKTIKLIAVVNIASNASDSSARLYIAKTDGTYSASSQNTGIAQAGDGTINEAQVGESPVTLTLTPVWTNISTVGSDGTVTYAIGGAMSGTVNGIAVMGTGQKIDTSGSSSSTSSGSSAYESFSKLFSLTLSSLGTLISMGMLFIMFKQWRGEKTQKSDDIVNKSPDPKNDKDNIGKEQQASDQQVDAARQPEAQKQVEATQASVDSLPATSQEITSTQQEIEARRTIEIQTGKITEVLKEAPPSDQMEQTVSEVMQAKTDLADGKVDASFSSLKDAGSSLVELTSDVQNNMSEAQKAQAEQVQKDIETSEEVQNKLEEQQQEAEERKAQDPADEIPPDDVSSDAPVDPPFGE